MSRCTSWTCPRCRFSCVVSFGTDGKGRLTESRERCLCERGLWPPAKAGTEKERNARLRKAGQCRDCGRPVEGTAGLAVRCAEHKRTARRDQERASRRRNKAKRRRSERKRRRRPEVRERRCGRRRELHAERMRNDPAYAAEYRRRRQRETLFNSPGREKYLERQRRHNSDPTRIARKRAHALARYYEKHPVRPSPVCATCGGPVPWSPGHGRPPKYHQTQACNPRWATSRAAREARDVARAAGAAAALPGDPECR